MFQRSPACSPRSFMEGIMSEECVALSWRTQTTNIMKNKMIASTVCLLVGMLSGAEAEIKSPFTEKFRKLERKSTGEWWNYKETKRGINLNVPRNEVLAFALYTTSAEELKLSAQLYPLLPEESREVTLEIERNGTWEKIATEEVVELGWSAHFRIQGWDTSESVKYRVRHGEQAEFTGTIKKDPVDQEEIVLASLSCNSSRTAGQRASIVKNLLHQDPDLLFFAGDQTYHHTEHTAGWIEFGLQFREVFRDRPVVTIPDDHDIGQANLWGDGGRKGASHKGAAGGYYYPKEYVNMVQRQQTWHLPDPVHPQPLESGIEVYYTNLIVGGVDFAIIEDRKFKSAPDGTIPKMGPRPDHINDPEYDRSAVDLPGLTLLGDAQLAFLDRWGQDWTGAEMKVVLSQTPFAGAAHCHGTPNNRLLADLDSNGWPQTGRKKAISALRRAWASHICGDQHLSTAFKHGIDAPGDGPMSFSSPAIVNTVYGRWWHPEDEKPGANPVPNSPLPWTGDYEDGFGNLIRMIAYANAENRKDEKQRADGWGLIRFNKKTRETTFECWHRYVDVTAPDAKQFDGWPLTFKISENDGRMVIGALAPLAEDGVVQVIENATQEILYTVREKAGFAPPVYADGTYTVKFGANTPDQVLSKEAFPVKE